MVRVMYWAIKMLEHCSCGNFGITQKLFNHKNNYEKITMTK
jgi:hypothetical protein